MGFAEVCCCPVSPAAFPPSNAQPKARFVVGALLLADEIAVVLKFTVFERHGMSSKFGAIPPKL